VRDAIARGHEVVALVRSRPTTQGVHQVVGDIRRPETWSTSLDGCDAVIHLAATYGDPMEQWDVVVHGTDQLVGAMAAKGVDRLVLVSSMSVYDYAALEPWQVLDEESPLDRSPEHRDGYTRAKLAQETLVKGVSGLRTTIVRPGAVYGRDRLWDGGVAVRLPMGLGVAVSPGAHEKLTYVENCSRAIVLAAERDDAAGAVLNIVDDDTPTQAEFAAALRRHGLAAPRAVPVPYRAAAIAARGAQFVNQHVLAGRLHLPEVAVPPRLDARHKPLRYTNDRAKRTLGWIPPFTLDEALVRIAAAANAA
jgi:nucleoside-diphosphate-sugar epimerase